MYETKTQEIVSAIFQSCQFKMLLKQEFTKIRMQEEFQQNKSDKLFVSELITEISDSFNTIIKYNIKQSLNQQYTLFFEDNSRVQKDIQQLKQKVLKLSIKFGNEQNSIIRGKVQKDDFWSGEKQSKILASFQQDLQLQQQRLQKKNQESFQLIKLRKQIDAIKSAIIKFSNNSILQFVQQTNEGIHKKIQQNYNKLKKQMQSISDAELQKSINSVMDTRYESLQSKLQRCFNDHAELMRKYDRLEDKLQTSLKSVWNVITMMQNNHEQQKKRKMSQKSIQEKVQKKGIYSFWK